MNAELIHQIDSAIRTSLEHRPVFDERLLSDVGERPDWLQWKDVTVPIRPYRVRCGHLGSADRVRRVMKRATTFPDEFDRSIENCIWDFILAGNTSECRTIDGRPFFRTGRTHSNNLFCGDLNTDVLGDVVAAMPYGSSVGIHLYIGNQNVVNANSVKNSRQFRGRVDFTTVPLITDRCGTTWFVLFTGRLTPLQYFYDPRNCRIDYHEDVGRDEHVWYVRPEIHLRYDDWCAMAMIRGD